MKIKILGTRANIEAKQSGHVKYTGILIDNKIMIDLGEENYLKLNPKYIFITHLHPDHAFFEYSNKNFNSKKAIHIYAPQPHKKIKHLNIINENDIIRAGDHTVIPVPVIHSIKVRSLGYIVEKKGKRIFFSGDVAWIEKKYRNKLKNLDLVITEGSYLRKGGMIRKDQKSGNIFGHNGIPDLVKMFAPFTTHIIIIHLGTWFMKNVKRGKEVIKSFGNKHLRVECAEDGQLFSI